MMKKKVSIKTIFFLVIFFSLIGSKLHSQHYPIQISTIITPPYSARLSDYVESGYDRVQVNINPLDANLVSYRVKIKLIIESFDGRIRIETDPAYLPPPVYLQGGIPEILTGYDLQSLFDPSHLIFKGMSRNEYLVKKKLPENFYRIGFVALDYNRATLGSDVAVSNTGSYTAGIFLNDPPILNMPASGIKLDLFDPQQIIFQWTPRHRGSPNSAFTAEYVFRLYEVWGTSSNPNVIVQTQQPVFETVTSSSRYSYGISDPLLIPGRQYVWTVQARDAGQRDLFRNNGFSEAWIFTYGDECKPPEDIQGVPVNGPGIELKWKDLRGHTDYLVQYRVSGSNGTWFEESCNLTNTRIFNLSYNTAYEMRIQANCNTFSSDFSAPVLVSLPEEPRVNFVCGGQNVLPPVTSEWKLPALVPGMSFTAGGFRCKVLEAQGSGGIFTGTCLVEVPFYGFSKVLHKFENITINTDGQMIAGKLVSVTDEAKNNQFMARIEELNTPRGTGYGSNELATLLGADTVLTVDGRINTIEVTGAGEISVTLSNGDVEVFDVGEGETALVEGSDGEQYFVDENGVVTRADQALANAAGGGSSVTSSNPDSLIAALPVVRFAPSQQMQFGFDSLRYEALRGQYTVATIREKEYIIPFKAVAAGTVDYVDAGIPDQDVFDPAGMGFRINQSPTTSSPGGDEKTLKVGVTSPVKGDDVVLDAFYTVTDTAGEKHEEKLGQMNIVAYDKQIIKLYIVPAGDETQYNREAVNTLINSVYRQAVTEWDIHWLDRFTSSAWDLNGDGIFDDTDKDDRMDYTPEMKAMIKAYREEPSTEIERQASYVFLFNGSHMADLSGYMPFNKQFAFVFTGSSGDTDIAHDIAHEIAHGTFNLRHTFSSENMYFQDQNTTDNLMDYSSQPNPTRLNKYQWDLIHDPEKMLFSWLQDEEEGAVIHEFLGKKYEVLFNKIYSKNYTLNTDYYDKIQNGETNNFVPEFTDDELKGLSDEEKAWVKKWEVRARKSNDVLLDVIDAIQKAGEGEKMSKIVAQQNKVYIIKCNFDGYDFNVAIYGNGDGTTLNKIFTKVVVSKIDDLSLEDNKKHLYVDVNEGRNYWILSLFEDGKSEPALIMQVSGKYDVLAAENWLKFLGILDEAKVGLPGISLSNNGKILRNGDYLYINKTPSMPSIKARITDESISNTTISLKIKYNIKYSYNGITYAFSDEGYEKNIDLKPEKDNNISFEKVRGGTLEIKNGDNKIVLHIRGENPTEEEVMGYISSKGASKYWFIKGVTNHESGCKQFNYINKSLSLAPIDEDKVYPGPFSSSEGQEGLPLYGGPRGFGLKQLDNWMSGGVNKICSAEQRWNWKSNIDGGIEVIEAKVNAIKSTNGSHSKWFKEITDWNKDNPDNKVEALSDLTLGGTTFTYASSSLFDWDYGNLSAGKKSFLDANLIKSFNGHYVIRLITPDEYEENGQTIKPAPYWEVVESRKQYVIDVLSKN